MARLKSAKFDILKSGTAWFNYAKLDRGKEEIEFSAILERQREKVTVFKYCFGPKGGKTGWSYIIIAIGGNLNNTFWCKDVCACAEGKYMLRMSKV